VGLGFFIFEISRSFSDTTLGPVSSPNKIPLPDNAQQSQETDTQVLDGIRTYNPSMKAVSDPHLIPCVHWDQQNKHKLIT